MTAHQGQPAGSPLSATERTRHRRLREQGRTDPAELFAVLAAGLVAHLGVLVVAPGDRAAAAIPGADRAAFPAT
jgi:hypothetical protein